MVEDEDLRRAEKVLSHLKMLTKSYSKIKAKKGRNLLMEKTLQGGTACIGSVKSFLEDKNVMKTFETNAAAILQGYPTKQQYNTCLGLLAARIMFT